MCSSRILVATTYPESDEPDPRRMKPERNVAPGRPEPDRGAPWKSAGTVCMWSNVGNVANAAGCASGLIHFPDRAAGREDEQTSSGLSVIVRADSPALRRGRCYNNQDDYVWAIERVRARHRNQVNGESGVVDVDGTNRPWPDCWHERSWNVQNQ